jgi:cytochrome P450
LSSADRVSSLPYSLLPRARCLATHCLVLIWAYFGSYYPAGEGKLYCEYEAVGTPATGSGGPLAGASFTIGNMVEAERRVRLPQPPGPRGRRISGSFPDYTRDQLGFLARCAGEYGDVVRMRFFNVGIVLLNHPDHIEQVLVGNNRNFIKDRAERSGLRFLGSGLLTSEGDFWRRQRRLAQPAFHRERINAYGETMVGNAERMLQTWRGGETRDIAAEMSRLTLGIVAKTLFGAISDAEREAVGAALRVILDRFTGGVLFKVPEGIPTPGNLRFRRAIRDLEGVIYGIVERRRQSGLDTGDLLSMLLAARDEETGEGMSDAQLRDEVMTILLAGHETTALNLAWTFYLLAEHPKAEAKLLAELEEALGDRAPAVADLAGLPYAGAMIKESLRLYPPAWGFGREALEDCGIGGYRVPAGTQIIVSQWVTHRDERFFERAQEFAPERWLDGSAGRLPRYAYFPFGGGPRLCIGRQFATLEATLLLATIARRFRLRPADDGPIIPRPSLSLRPEGGMRMVPEER